MSRGLTDLVPTSRSLRSELALGPVAPLRCSPPRLEVTVSLQVYWIKKESRVPSWVEHSGLREGADPGTSERASGAMCRTS